jgi:osmoprotectant transport system permease protein
VNVITEFFEKLGPDIWLHSYQHLLLTAAAMAIATAIALPTGVLLTRCPWRPVVALVLGGVGIVQTIPSLALVAFIALIFILVTLPTIGIFPALTALVLYALLPITRNTYTGIRQVDSTVIEVARGMGMTPAQILFKIELPLSLSVIMAGIRISTVWTIGVACLVTFVGGGGLGDLIMQGLRSWHADYLIAGTAPAALMAIVFDFALSGFEKWLTPSGMEVST